MVSEMSFMGAVISLALTVWFVVFTVFIIQRLDKIIELLRNK